MNALVDTSVWVWAARAPEVREELQRRALVGEIATCHPVALELLYSARDAEEFRYVRGRLARLPTVPVDDAVWERAVDVYERLADQGGAHQRQVSHPDLLIAAAAELAGIPILHYDEDYDRIAAVTGQDARWVRPRGSL